MQEGSVNIGIRELISLMSGEIARRVTDELKTTHIDPLNAEVAELKLRCVECRSQPMTTTTTTTTSTDLTIARWKGAFDAVWKVGVVALALVEAYHYLFQAH